MKTKCFDCRFSRPLAKKGIYCDNAASIFRRHDVTKEVWVMGATTQNCPDFKHEEYGPDPVFQNCCDTSRALMDWGSLYIVPPREKGRKPLFILKSSFWFIKFWNIKIDHCPGCGSPLRMRMPKPKGKKK